MPIPLTQPQIPSAKLPTIGSGLEIAIVGTRRRPWTEFGTGAPKYGNDGRPREQLVVTGVVVSQQNAVAGDGTGVDRPLNVGEIVTLWLHSHHWFRYIEANRAHGVVNVGDILLWHYTHDEPSSQGGANPKKVREVSLRRPRPDEAQWVQRAEAAYYEMGFDKPEAPGPQGTSPGVPYGQGQPPAAAPYGTPEPAPAYGQQSMPYGSQAPAQQPQTGYQPTQNIDPNQPNFDPGF